MIVTRTFGYYYGFSCFFGIIIRINANVYQPDCT